MIVYLDTSALNRIFDDQSQPRIFLETSSMLMVFGLIENKEITIVSSEVLIYENSRNPFIERREFVSEILRKARVVQAITAGTITRANELEVTGIKGMDALHLASAEQRKALYFITCDDRIVQRYSGTVTAVKPTEFTMRYLKQVTDNADC